MNVQNAIGTGKVMLNNYKRTYTIEMKENTKLNCN